MPLDIYFLVQNVPFQSWDKVYQNFNKVTVGIFALVYCTQVVGGVGGDVMVLFELVIFVVVVV